MPQTKIPAIVSRGFRQYIRDLNEKRGGYQGVVLSPDHYTGVQRLEGSSCAYLFSAPRLDGYPAIKIEVRRRGEIAASCLRSPVSSASR